LWDDTTWYRSATFNDHHRVSGIDHYIFSIARAPRRLYNTIWVHRPVGDSAYTRREWWLVHTVHAELATLIDRALAAADAPSVADLTRRQRQTLDGLLDGDSEKQIAQRLGLSRATVHEYVTAIYRHFNAASRGELLARFVGVARPPREAGE
jgi:DNA-binding CsgD family transcriptional regulator